MTRWARDDRGSAVVEFLGAALLLLIPLVYLVLALAQVQAGAFAAEAAAREAARILAGGPPASAQAARAVELAFADQRLPVAADDVLTVTCESARCDEPGARLRVEVTAAVPLPLVPAFAREALPTEVTVRAGSLAVVDRFREAP